MVREVGGIAEGSGVEEIRAGVSLEEGLPPTGPVLIRDQGGRAP